MSHSSFRKEVHPLFNRVVLERAFGYLSPQSLKNVRLVCKLWESTASPFLQSSTWVTLLRGRGTDNGQKSFKNFISYIKDLPEEEIFFRNYHIEHWILNERRERNLPIFWGKCGPTMRKLHLAHVIFYEVEIIRNVLYHWTPSLEELNMEDCLFYTIVEENIPSTTSNTEYLEKEDFDEEYVFFDYYDHISVEQLKGVEKVDGLPCNIGMRSITYDQWGDEVFPLDWCEVFEAFPNLKELKIPSSISEQDLTTILSKTGGLNLKCIALHKSPSREGPSSLTDEHLLQISSKENQLPQLELHVGSNVTTSGLSSILSQNECLTSLTVLLSCESAAPPSFDLSQYSLKFPNLKRLTFSKDIVAGSMPKIMSGMPALQTLKLGETSGELCWDETADNLWNSEDVCLFKLLESFSCLYVIKTLAFYEKTCTSFPYLRRLESPLNDEQIRIVFKNLSKLEELIVHDRYLSDEGITGCPAVLDEQTEWSPTSLRRYPYIGDLKCLRKFSLQYWKYLDITDASVYQGLIDVVNLGYLRLSKTNISLMALQDLIAAKSSLVTLVSPLISKGDAR